MPPLEWVDCTGEKKKNPVCRSSCNVVSCTCVVSHIWHKVALNKGLNSKDAADIRTVCLEMK